MTSDEASLQHLASFMTFTWNNFDVNDWIIVESGSISPKRKDISMLQIGLCLTIFVTFLNLQYGTRALYAFGLVCGNVKVVLILASVLSCLFFLTFTQLLLSLFVCNWKTQHFWREFGEALGCSQKESDSRLVAPPSSVGIQKIYKYIYLYMVGRTYDWQTRHTN